MKSKIGNLSRNCLLVALIVILGVFSAIPADSIVSAAPGTCEQCGQVALPAGSSGSAHPHPIMRLSAAQIQAENELLKTASVAYIDPVIMERMNAGGDTTAKSLLSLIQYTPSERDQWNCGNCWVWTGTACLEAALKVQRNIKNRLSVQYLNSNYSGGTGSGWAGCGGGAGDFANYYNGTLHKAIPWSNTNAGWADANKGGCPDTTAMPAGSISTTPYYPITSVAWALINTRTDQGVNQATAITNIKNVLNQNKAIYLGFSLANNTMWSDFFSFWDGEPESTIWANGFSHGQTWVSGEGGSHAVTIVGFDDTPAGTANDYWIALNSWGTASGGAP